MSENIKAVQLKCGLDSVIATMLCIKVYCNAFMYILLLVHGL